MTEHDEQGFVRHLLADEPTPAMPNDIFERLDAAVRAEARSRAAEHEQRAEQERRITAAKCSTVDRVDGAQADDLARKQMLDEVRRVLRRH